MLTHTRGDLALVLVLVFAPAALWAAASDLVDTALLGDRGIAMESPAAGPGSVSHLGGFGDVDGDGLSDFGVVAFEDSTTHRSVLHIVSGRPRAEWQAQAPSEMLLGLERVLALRGSGRVRVSPAGDLDGDGLAEVLFSADSYQPTPEAAHGALFLLWGWPSWPAGRADLDDVPESISGSVFWSSDEAVSQVGYNGIALVGDVNADGRPDLAVGMFGNRALQRPSQVQVVFGQVGRPFPSAELVDLAGVGGSRPGTTLIVSPGGGMSASVEGLGDFNGDGLDDMAVGDDANVYVVFGRREFPPVLRLAEGDADIAIAGPGPAMVYGMNDQIAGPGDVNGDGLADLLIGCAADQINVPGEEPRRSEVAIVYGRRDFPPRVAYTEIPEGLCTRIVPASGGFQQTAFGRYVAAGGDLNLDGVPDLLIGEPLATISGKQRAGKAHVLYGRRDLGAEWDLSQPYEGIEIRGSLSSGWLGLVKPGGDIDGDGAPDILVAEHNRELPVAGHGKAFVIWGQASGERPLTLLSVTPGQGPARGGTLVVLRGSGFTSEAWVSFAGRPSGTVSLAAASELRVLPPPAESLGAVDVVVEVAGERRILGDAYVYTKNLREIDLAGPSPGVARLEGAPSCLSGTRLCFADLTADGTEDLVVGSTCPEGWVVTVVPGGRELPDRPDLLGPESPFERLVLTLPESEEGRGIAELSAVGDVNGDGAADVGTSKEVSQGYLILGGPHHAEAVERGLEEEVASGRAVRIVGDPVTRYWKVSLVPLGDVTGDGIDDLLAGLGFAVGGEPGALVVLSGRREWPEEVDLTADSGIVARIAGWSDESFGEVSGAGDFNGDGRPDVIAQGTVAPHSIACWVIYGGPGLAGARHLPDLVSRGLATEIGLRHLEDGESVKLSGLGDFDGDGYGDVAIGAGMAGGAINPGETYVVAGGASLPESFEVEGWPGALRILGPGDLAYSGTALGPAGDFDGDGLADLWVDSRKPVEPFDPPQHYIVFGRERLGGAVRLDRLGADGVLLEGANPLTWSVGSRPYCAGDFNGDGQRDLAIAETPMDVSPDLSGAVFVVYGPPSAVAFVRGDAGFDGSVDISDAIFTLSYLFLGGAAPRCEDAADADDSGALELTDPIFLLGHLFLGRPEPPAPFPEEGDDPTEDPLGCRGV